MPEAEKDATLEVWQEPVRGASFPPHLFGLSGIEQLRLFLTGRVAPPPIRYLVGMRPTEIGVGSAAFTMPITGWLRTPQGPVTGGTVAILADGPLGTAVQSVLPPATPYTTSELSLNLVRPVPEGGTLLARGRLVHGGRRLALSEAFVTDGAGRLIAHSTSRCVIMPPVDVPSPPPDIPLTPPDPDGWIPPFERVPRGEVLEASVWADRSGLDVMRSHIRGDLPAPPLGHLLGTGPIAADEGSCVFAMQATGWLCSPSGFVEGGVLACFADLAIGGAIQTTVPAGTAMAPTDLRVQFLRPVAPDGQQLKAHAQVEHRGRSVAVARGEVVSASGKLVALATGSALILPGRRVDLRDEQALN
jgi:uncharacterized protein (TIGR00369 family)